MTEHGKPEISAEYAEFASLPSEDVKALLDQELAEIDRLVGDSRDG